MGRFRAKPSTVSTAPTISIRRKELPMIFSASSLRPAPRSMEHRGAPPMPNRLANAITTEITGRHSPSPVRDRVAWSGIRPM